MTNSEKIRSLSDEELAKFLDGWEVGDINRGIFFCSACNGDEENRCWQCTEYWLDEEADEEEYSALFRTMEPHAAPPAPHGEWVFISYVPGNEKEEIIMCSKCRHIMTNNRVERPQCCPNCGAKMDKSDKNEESEDENDA